MADLSAHRTLVKSPPELWSELSEVESLARHLGELGEIRITKVEPETTVAWEGEQISGTVALEQSGWGTKVTFTAAVPEPDSPAVEAEAPPAQETAPAAEAAPTADAAAAAEPERAAAAEPEAAEAEEPRRGFWARLFGRRRDPDPVADAEPEPPAAVAPEAVAPEPVAPAEPEPVATIDPEPPLVAETRPAAPDAEVVLRVLHDTLDALGQAHHRPFSRG